MECISLCNFGCNRPSIKQFKNGMNCCSNHYLSCPGVKETRRKNNLLKYGVENVFQLDFVKELSIQKHLENYGVKNPSQSENIKKKKEKTCMENYGVSHPLKSIEVQNSLKETNLEKYGVDNVRKSSKVKEKIYQTNLERYGVEHPAQCQTILDKMMKTNIKRYGIHHTKTIEFKNKLKHQNIEKYGVICSLQSKSSLQKSKETNLRKYGVEYSNQNPEIFAKSKKFKRKEYKFPSSKIEYIQGYEPFALDILLNDQSILENDIFVKPTEMPGIFYVINDKIFRYHPDIFVKSQNKIIEVKSSYTQKCDIEKNLLKKQATIELGYIHETWVIGRKGELLEVIF